MQAARSGNTIDTLNLAVNRLAAGGSAQQATGVRGASFSRQQAAQPPQQGGKGRVDIPMEPVSKSLRSIDGAWLEYRSGTDKKPSIRQLIDDHGKDWQSSQFKYHRNTWLKKRKLISAIEAIKAIRQTSGSNAAKLLETARKVTGESVNTFASALPVLSHLVDVAGKCKSSSGDWRPLHFGDELYDVYSRYTNDLRNHLKLNTSLV